jgi:hypothetical protein
MLELHNAIRKEALAFRDLDPPFDMRLGWSETYDGIFGERFEAVTGFPDLFEHLARNGRVLVVGPGGGAKSVLLRRVAKEAARRGYLPVVANLKNWTAKDYDDWRPLETYTQRLDFLLARFATPPIRASDLDVLGLGATCLVMVDGLNEVTANIGSEMLNALDDFVRFSIRTWVVVNDRLSRRQLKNPERWELALVLPLTDEEILRHVKNNPAMLGFWKSAASSARALLRTPYFFDSFLRQGGMKSTRAEELRDYFSRHAVGPDDLPRIAEAAYAVYEAGSRTFELGTFCEIAGAELTDRLTASGAIVRSGDLAYFDHHLKHDFLASFYLASHSELWGSDSFNRITFMASSFDTVVLAMEELPRERTDRFIRSLYDWNIYGAGYALSEGRHDNVSSEMSTVVHAMFAERRWDLIQASGKAASDVLHQLMTQLSKRLLEAATLDDVLDIIRREPGNEEWFLAWRDLFTAPVGSPATDEDLNHLVELDSVMGWTSANVLRRKTLGRGHVEIVRNALRTGPEPVIRWRAAHVLGRLPSEENVALLAESLNDDSSEVKYGATRSLIEIAAQAGGPLAGDVFHRLAMAAGALAAHRNVVNEFKRALIVVPERAPRDWTQLALPAVSAFQQATAERIGREEWDRTMQSLVSAYGY